MQYNKTIMDTTKSIEIIEGMLQESRKSLHRNSFYFILWGLLMAPAGIIESSFIDTKNSWMVWPIAGMLGGIISTIYSKKEAQRSGVQTAIDRITKYTWGAFGFALLFGIAFSIFNQLLPHSLVLLIAGFATFITGGITKFKPFIYGGIALELGAIACAFFVPPSLQGFVFAISISLGYIVPGFILKKSENG